MSKRRSAFYAAFDDRGACLGASTDKEGAIEDAYAFLTKDGADPLVHPDGSPRLTFTLPCSLKFHAFVTSWREGVERHRPLAIVHVPTGEARLRSEASADYISMAQVIAGTFT